MTNNGGILQFGEAHQAAEVIDMIDQAVAASLRPFGIAVAAQIRGHDMEMRLQFDNVLASPHTAGVTREARVNMGRIAAEQILDALDGKRPPRVVNPEVWPAYVKRFERAFGFAPK